MSDPQSTLLSAATIARFWAKVNKDGPIIRPEYGPCWPWSGAEARGRGYIRVPRASLPTKLEIAPRIAYELATGGIPDAALYVCHVCDFGLCVRNDEVGVYVVGDVEFVRYGHLFLATNSQNIIDAVAKGRNGAVTHPERARRNENHPSAKLTPKQIEAIRRSYSNHHIPQREMAEIAGISQAQLSRIVRGESWSL